MKLFEILLLKEEEQNIVNTLLKKKDISSALILRTNYAYLIPEILKHIHQFSKTKKVILAKIENDFCFIKQIKIDLLNIRYERAYWLPDWAECQNNQKMEIKTWVATVQVEYLEGNELKIKELEYSIETGYEYTFEDPPSDEWGILDVEYNKVKWIKGNKDTNYIKRLIICND